MAQLSCNGEWLDFKGYQGTPFMLRVEDIHRLNIKPTKPALGIIYLKDPSTTTFSVTKEEYNEIKSLIMGETLEGRC